MLRRRLVFLALLTGAVFLLLVTAQACPAAVPVQTVDPTTGSAARHLMLMLVYAAIALLFSSLCSVAEAVLLSVTPSYVVNLRNTHPASGNRLSRVRKKIERSLAAILTLNTIAHTLGAGGAGAEAAAYFGEQYVGAAMAVLTLLILYVSEIIPKTIGALYWRALAPVTARFVEGLVWLLYPLLVISDLLTNLLTQGREMHQISREEIAAMADLGAAAGQLDESESRILKNVFRLPGLRVADVMTPRIVVFALDEDQTVADVLAQPRPIEFTRIPIFDSHRDNITGFVLRGDLLSNQLHAEGKAKLRDLRRDLDGVPKRMPLNVALDRMLSSRQHILLVVDEYGGMDGIVTLEDLLETLIGIEIVDEFDRIEDMRRLARQKWRDRMQHLGIDVEEHGDFGPQQE